MTTEQKTVSHGGRRAGSGRKKRESVGVFLRLAPDVAAYIQSHKPASAVVETAIRKLLSGGE